MSKEAKLARLKAALEQKEGDRVPCSDFFWTGFTKRAREIWGKDVDLYRKYDLDYIVINPNMDPVIKDFVTLEETEDHVLVETGFGAKILRKGDLVMPHFDSFAVNEPEEMEDFILEPGSDERRIFRTGDDQINGLGDDIVRNIPSWNERVDAYCKDFPVFGSTCEGYEFVWRCIGTENALMWMLVEEEAFAAFMERIGEFLLDLVKLQIKHSNGRLSGFYIWGDIAYVNGMLFSPEMWRKYFKPITERLIKEIKDAGLMVIYHGCGDARKVYQDFIDIGLQGYNPVEVKAHLDVVELQKEYGGRLTFVGNIDVRELESGDKNRIKKEVLYKLQAAQGGGWISQSDHSVSNDVHPEDYMYYVNLIKEYGKFPLDMERIKKELEEL